MITTMKELRRAWKRFNVPRICLCDGKVWKPKKGDPAWIQCPGLPAFSFRTFLRTGIVLPVPADRVRNLKIGEAREAGYIIRHPVNGVFPIVSRKLGEKLEQSRIRPVKRQGRFSARHAAAFIAKQALSLEMAADFVMQQWPSHQHRMTFGTGWTRKEEVILNPGGQKYRALVDYLGRLEQIGATKALQKELRRVENQVETSIDQLMEQVGPEVVRLKNEAHNLARGLYRNVNSRSEIARKIRSLRRNKLKYGPLAPESKMTPDQVRAIMEG